MLHIKNVKKTLVSKVQKFVLGELNFKISEGELICVVGSSGSGKTTLFNLLSGILTTDEGEIRFNGKLMLGPPHRLMPATEGMAIVQQDLNLNFFGTVNDNIAVTLPNTDVGYKAKRVDEILKIIHIEDLKYRQVSSLSGGQQQRVAIAKALAPNPKILLLDEPFSNLDSILKADFKRDLKNLVKELGISIFMITHDPLDALSLSDKILVIEHGKIIQFDETKTVYQNPASEYCSKLFGDANYFSKDELNKIFNKNISSESKVVRPHEILIDNNKGVEAIIKNIEYHGFYELVLVNCCEKDIFVNNFDLDKYSVGQQIKITIK